ncbi:protein singles bar [Nasonia vitripennis]|uniref:MARVEL domain-containing protein n=1 Tax=Nasonia vitripennis TaxID=7425 RepID=A0A7M7G775_NASVI|nr:protein singles bar [Nasonia vitripennis]XP_016844841.1 protein singles bar [Nasonia vitripennis]
MIKFGGGANNNSSAGGRGPIIRMANTNSHGQGGIDCCFCRCCTCIHLEYLRTVPGIIKLLETVISGFIQSLLINYGLRYSATIGSAFEGALTTSSACFLTSAVLLACYVISEKSYRLIRASLFEMMFNSLSCFLYLSSTAYLAFATKMFLWPMYVITPGFDVYPAMTAAYMLSGVVGILHGTDAYFSLQHYRSQR